MKVDDKVTNNPQINKSFHHKNQSNNSIASPEKEITSSCVKAEVDLAVVQERCTIKKVESLDHQLLCLVEQLSTSATSGTASCSA